MISECSKSNHKCNFIGGPRCFFLFQTDIDEKRGRYKNMNGIDPGTHRMLGQLHKELISVIYENEQAENEQGSKGPDGHIRTKEGDQEEQGSDEQDVEDCQNHMWIYGLKGGHFSIVWPVDLWRTLGPILPTPV